ncbi:DUF4214 domain-containing protein [Massilia sp. TS11]|uniref:DUF4214 domain-containing protein n=1 Tax=Massilia sp. TS11 TaxID=2908003 RepID=UPI001EDC8DBE|nr:DUF4214 domain-containing protein [Massilia sp. TS11]MCG2584976.1 DUF4214 domain-containing protein [Massilia sp. TS11]
MNHPIVLGPAIGSPGVTSYASIQTLFIAYLGRPADMLAMEYWAGKFASARSLDALQSALANDGSFIMASGNTPLGMIKTIYQNSFGHAPTAEALTYWGAQLNSGAVTASTLGASIVAAASGTDGTAMREKLIAASAFDSFWQTTGGLDTNDMLALVGGSGRWLGPVHDSASLSTALSQLSDMFTNIPDVVIQPAGSAAVTTAAQGSLSGFTFGDILSGVGPAMSSGVQALYVAYFGRPADIGGLNFWSTVAARTHSLDAVQSGIAGSSEFTSNHLSTAQMVNQIYQNAFARPADVGGLSYWTGLVNEGKLSVNNLGGAIMAGAQGGDALVLRDKLVAANAFDMYLQTSNADEVLNPALFLSDMHNWLGRVHDDASMISQIATLDNGDLMYPAVLPEIVGQPSIVHV